MTSARAVKLFEYEFYENEYNGFSIHSCYFYAALIFINLRFVIPSIVKMFKHGGRAFWCLIPSIKNLTVYSITHSTRLSLLIFFHL